MGVTNHSLWVKTNIVPDENYPCFGAQSHLLKKNKCRLKIHAFFLRLFLAKKMTFGRHYLYLSMQIAERLITDAKATNLSMLTAERL